MIEDPAAAEETDEVHESRPPLAVDYHVCDPQLGPKSPLRSWLKGIGISRSRRGGSRYVPYRCFPRTRELDNDTRAAIRELEETPRVYHGAVAARLLERRYGIACPCAFADVRMCADLLEFYPFELKDLISSCIRPVPGFPARRHAERARDHSAIILALFLDWNDRIYRENLDAVYDIEHSVIEPIVRMIEDGLLLDAERLEEGLSALNRQAHAARERAQEAVGRWFSPSRPADVRAVLYERLGLEAAQGMNDRHSEIDRHKLRRLANQDSTGVATLLLDCEEAMMMARRAGSIFIANYQWNGRIHPDIDTLGSPTGGFTCSDPDLQAVPPALLGAFVAPRGCLLLEAKFSQLELRVLAHFSQDKNLLAAFSDPGAGVDVHRRTAAAALAKAEEQVSEQERNRIGMAINRGVASGQNDAWLADALEILPERANQFMGRFFARYSRVRHWIDAVEKAAETDGEARSLYGRRRTIAGLGAWERAGYSRAPRWAAHHIISATVADITKLSIARLYDALPEGCRLLLPLADGVLMEVPQGRVKEIAKLVRQTMEEPPTDFSVPLRVKLSRGKTWADCKGRPQRVEQDSNPS